MQNIPISPLQLYTTRNFAGLTEQNHLSNAYLTEPEKVGAVLAYAFGTDYKYAGGSTSIISLLTGGIGNTMEVANREYQWALHGENERAIEVVSNPGDGGTTPGLSGSTFRVKLAEKWFEATDNLRSDDGTKVRVQEEPYQEGNGYVYTLVLTSTDRTFIDPTQIAAGARFSKDFSTVEEASIKGGSTNYATPFQLRNQLTTLRKHYGVTRSAATDVLIIELRDPSEPNKKTKLWVKLAEWVAMAQWYREIDYSLIYSEYSKNPITGINGVQGQNGRPVYTGAGLRQQIAPANVRYYNKLTYKILDEFLLDLSYQADKWGGNTKFVAFTGKMGMRAFSDAISTKFNGVAPNITITNNSGQFIGGRGNELVFEGDQWITAKFPNGVELTVKEMPLYDNLTMHRTLHPVSKKPIESYRFTIMNFGVKNGEGNIVKVAKKDSEMAMWHVAGSTDPFGGVAKSINTQRSTGIDGYEVHFLSECGIMLKDPTSCGELIFSSDY